MLAFWSSQQFWASRSDLRTLSIACFMFSTGPTNLQIMPSKYMLPKSQNSRIASHCGGCPNHRSHGLLMSIVFGHLFYDIRGMAFSFFLLKFQDTRLWLPVAWPDHARLAHVKSQKSRSTQHHILVLNRQNVSTMWPQWSSIGFSENHGIPLSQWLGLTG